MDEIISIGPRLRSRRTELGWTQEELSDRAGISADLIGKLERGVRRSCRWSTIVKLAQALDLDPGDLTGKGSRVTPTGENGILAVRNAIYDPVLLPGLDVREDIASASPDELWRSVERSYGAYFAGEFGVLAADLPGLLSACRLAREDHGAAVVAAAFSHAYQLAASLLVHAGRDDAALTAVERAITAVREGDDEYRAATMYGTYAWALLHIGRYREAERLVVRIADGIRPAMTPKTDPHQLSAWGGLMLYAAVIAGSDGREDDAEEYLAAAGAAAALMTQDRHDYWVSFGPSQVAMQSTHIWTALEQPEKALRAHRRLDRHDLLPIQWGRHLLNVSYSLRLRRRTDQAIHVAAEARAISPEWFRHQRFAASLVDGLRQDKARISGVLAEMVSDIRHG
ncbi:hypothetical protein GCM10027294_52030 [Marinactinospora endophytica]